MFALVTDNTIQSIGRLPSSARRADVLDANGLPAGDWVMGLGTAPPELVAATGWVEVVDTPRPADTATTTHDHSVTLMAGVPTVTWTERAKTTDEQASETRQANDAAIRSQVEAHMADLAAITGSSGTLTTAQLSNAVRVLARGQRRLIRLTIGLLDGTD